MDPLEGDAYTERKLRQMAHDLTQMADAMKLAREVRDGLHAVGSDVIPPTACSQTLRELATWHLQDHGTIGCAGAKFKRTNQWPPIAGAVCTTVEDVCVKVDQDKDDIIAQVHADRVIITTEATANYDALSSSLLDQTATVITDMSANQAATIAALVGYLDPATGTAGLPVVQTRNRLGLNSVDAYSLFEVVNIIRNGLAVLTTNVATLQTSVDVANDKLGTWGYPTDTVKTHLTHIQTAVGGVSDQVTGVSNQVTTVGTTTDAVHLQTAGISAGLIIQFAKFVGGTLAVPLAEWILGTNTAPPESTLTPLTAVPIVSNDEVSIDPGMYGITLFLDAPADWAHRSGPPNHYVPALAYISFYGVDGWLLDPQPIHTEFTQFFPLPQGASAFAVSLAVGVTGTYTVLVIP